MEAGLDCAIIIPTLNEANSIGQLLDEISEVLGKDNYVTIVVDGHSKDRTDEIARSKGAEVVFQRNTGYGDALRTGLKYVRKHSDAKLVIMMDGDLSYDPRDIPKLVEPITNDEADMVIGNRFPRMEKGAMTAVNTFGNRLISWAARATLRINVHDTQCGFRAFRPELFDQITPTTEGMPFATEMIAEAKTAGATIAEVPVAYRPRLGSTKLSPLKDGLRILGTILRLTRDTQPLMFFGGAGLILGVVGLVLGLDVTLEWWATHSVGRLPIVMLSVLLLVAAMQFLTLGLVADMIKRLRR